MEHQPTSAGEVGGFGGFGDVGGARELLAVRVFSYALVGTATAIGVGLVFAGAELPSPGAVPLLALVVALAVNRFALFPTELAATAEAAVLLAAVVGFRDDAIFVGPLVVALLVGPLDSLHWAQRSYVRMAFNAGNRAWSVLGASVAFVGVRQIAGSSALGVAVGIVVATAVFAVLDGAWSVVLFRLHRESWRAATHHLLEIDALTIPVALYGAAAGVLAGELSWLATALALVPVAFVPELVFAHRRWRATYVRDAVVALTVAAGFVAVALVTPVPNTATLVTLVLLGVVGGVEFGIGASARVAPMLAVVVIAAVLVPSGSRSFFAAALVAVVGTLTARWRSTPVARAGVVGAVTIAALAGLLAAAVFRVAPGSGATRGGGALVAGLVFEFAVMATMPDAARRRGASTGVWGLPLLGAAVGWAFVWRLVGVGGGGLFVLLMAATLVSAVWWGAPSWSSTLIARSVSGRVSRGHTGVLAVVTITAVLAAAAAAVAEDAQARLLCGWVAVGLGESAIAMVSLGVRQWRFVTRARVQGLVVLSIAAVVLAVVAPPLARAGSGWTPALVAGLMMLAALVARIPARCLRRPPVSPRVESVRDR